MKRHTPRQHIPETLLRTVEVSRIDSSESEGAFNEFIEEQLEDLVDHILNEGDLGNRGSDIIVEMDDIQPPTLVYGDTGGGGSGQGQGPGGEKGRISFGLPFEKFMDLVAAKLQLPDLTKEGKGRIKQISYEFKTFGPSGAILDKRRTFRRALRTSIGTGVYAPDRGKLDVFVRRRDRRFKLPVRVERPRYKAVVFYMGDISYSTYGERLEIEKRIANFIHNWLDYNYGPNNVEHRFFVHDAAAYEVRPEEFYTVKNAGGTQASVIFELVSQIAFNEYDTESTNFYAFYFGDGELFGNDAGDIVRIIAETMRPTFNRIGVVEVRPSRISQLANKLNETFEHDRVVRVGEIREKKQTIEIIKLLFRSEGREEH